MSSFRGQRGQRREHYIGDGQYREVATLACSYERMRRFDKAAEEWVNASRLIDWRKPEKAQAQQEYVNNRIRFCQTFGRRLQMMTARSAA